MGVVAERRKVDARRAAAGVVGIARRQVTGVRDDRALAADADAVAAPRRNRPGCESSTVGVIADDPRSRRRYRAVPDAALLRHGLGAAGLALRFTQYTPWFAAVPGTWKTA